MRCDGIDAIGGEKRAGKADAGFADTGANCADENLAMVDEAAGEGDEAGDGVKGCEGAGPSPRQVGQGSESGCGGCCCVHGAVMPQSGRECQL